MTGGAVLLCGINSNKDDWSGYFSSRFFLLLIVSHWSGAVLHETRGLFCLHGK